MELKRFIKEEDGSGVVELILIIVVLIAMVGLFRNKIKETIEMILKKIHANADAI